MERHIEEETIPKEGEEPIEEEQKVHIAKKLRFAMMTEGFYAPNKPKKPKQKYNQH